jgi:hypothetical protein
MVFDTKISVVGTELKQIRQYLKKCSFGDEKYTRTDILLYSSDFKIIFGPTFPLYGVGTVWCP